MTGTSPTARQRELGTRMRGLRNEHNMTVEEVAERLLCSATKISRLETGARRPSLRDVRDLSKPIQQELEKFFIATDELEDKKLEILGWKGPKIAMKAIQDSAKTFAKDGE